MGTTRISELTGHARWKEGTVRCIGPSGAVLWGEGSADPLGLLLAAVESELMEAIAIAAEECRASLLYLEASAMARLVHDDDGNHRLLDLIVRPRIGVRGGPEADRLKEMLPRLTRTMVTQAFIRPAPRIEPVFESWSEPAMEASAHH